MKLPGNIVPARLDATTLEALQRDHGVDANVTKAFLSDWTGHYCEFEIGGIMWKYDEAGRLIDAYRWVTTSPFNGRRSNVDHASLNVQPVAIAFSQAEATSFFDLARKREGGLYDPSRSKARICYEVTTHGRCIGKVVKVVYDAAEALDIPRQQWLAVTPEGRVWSSYGRTREEAGRYLLNESTKKPTTELLAA